MLKWVHHIGDSFQVDLIAGLIIGVMLIPQGMAYGMLAGMPPIYGLYSSIAPSLAYMCMGTSIHLQVGTNAPISILVVDSLAPVLTAEGITGDCSSAPNSNDCYITLQATMAVSMIAGVIYIFMGIFQMGIITAFMPNPVLSGFTTGAAGIIITSNVKHFLGMPNVPRGSFVDTWSYILGHMGETNGMATLIGVASLVVLFGLKWVNQTYKKRLPFPIPEQLIVLVAATALVYTFKLNESEAVPVVGAVPSGLYSPSMPDISADLLSKLIQPAALTAVVTYIVTVNIAKSLGNSHNYNVDSNQELYALAGASIVGGLCGSYPPSASFSRSALTAVAGSETPFHNFWYIPALTLTLIPTLNLISTLTHLGRR